MFYILKEMYMTRIAIAANLPYPIPKRFKIYDCCGCASYLMLPRKNGKYRYSMAQLRR